MPDQRLKTIAAILLLLGVGFAAGRHLPAAPDFPPASNGAASATAAKPPPASPPPAPPSPPSAPPVDRHAQDQYDRLHEIDVELAELAEDDATDQLKDLNRQMQTDRQRIADLRNQLSASQRDLLNESLRASPGTRGQQRLEYQEQATALMQELNDAKIAISEQQRILDLTFATSPDDPPLPALRAEMARRKTAAASLEQQIADLYANETDSLAAASAEEQGRLRSWRNHQVDLEEAYASAVSDLAVARETYLNLAAENAENRKKAQALNAERKALLQARKS